MIFYKTYKTTGYYFQGVNNWYVFNRAGVRIRNRTRNKPFRRCSRNAPALLITIEVRKIIVSLNVLNSRPRPRVLPYPDPTNSRDALFWEFADLEDEKHIVNVEGSGYTTDVEDEEHTTDVNPD